VNVQQKNDPANIAGSKTQSKWWRDPDLRGWFQIVVISLLIPIFGSVYAYFNQVHSRQIADDQLHETELEIYVDHMANLILVKAPGLPATPAVGAESTPAVGIEDDVVKVNFATTYTQNILRDLGSDGSRKGIVVQILYNLGLIKSPNPTVSLQRQQLENVDLSGLRLPGISLQNAVLAKAILKGAVFVNGSLASADLTDADLTCANLSGVEFAGATLTGADLTGASVSMDKLAQAHLDNTTLPDGSKDQLDQTHLTPDRKKCS
jgi:hypothetical protein